MLWGELFAKLADGADALAVQRGDHVARLYAGFFRRRTGRDVSNEDSLAIGRSKKRAKLPAEIFGVNASMREVADYYAEEGYVVLAPDLFWRLEPGIELGYSEADFNKAFGYYQRFDANQSIKDSADALKVLRARPECVGKVGALGFCLGGKLAYLVAARTDVDCAVCYYGVGIEADIGEAAQVQRPMVFHFAELDKYAPAEAREQIKAAFAKRPDVEFYLYPGCDHAFACVEQTMVLGK